MEKLNPVFTFPTWDTVERDEEHKKLMLKGSGEGDIDRIHLILAEIRVRVR